MFLYPLFCIGIASLLYNSFPFASWHINYNIIPAPSKLKITCWVAFYSKLLTRDILAKHGLTTDSSCVIYSNNMETSDCPFLHCEFTMQIWRSLLHELSLLDLPASLGGSVALMAMFDHLFTPHCLLELHLPGGPLVGLFRTQ